MQTEIMDLPAVVCARCEYDLRGLERAGRCPECGCEIEASWRRAEALDAAGVLPLALSSRRWLKWMALGCACVLVAAIGALADAALVSWGPHSQWLDTVNGLSRMVFMFAGVWMLGSREPAMPGRLNGRTIRYGIRAIAILFVAVPFAAGVYPVGAAAMMSFWRHVGILQAIIGSLATALVLLRVADGARRAGRTGFRLFLFILSVLAPLLVLTQCIVNPEIKYSTAALWSLIPDPVIGFSQAILIVPRNWMHHFDSTQGIAVWSAQAILSLAILLTLALAGNMFWRAMAETDSSDASDPS